MRRKLQAKLNSKKGFTLVELLIVVAIIAILVAVSIPMVTGSLDKARQATDDANVRAAKGAAMVEYLTGEELSDLETADVSYYYDAEEGKVYKTDEVGNHDFTGYNQKAIGMDAAAGQTSTVAAKKGIVQVTINDDGGISTCWVMASTIGN